VRSSPRAKLILDALPEEVRVGFADALAELVLAMVEQDGEETDESGDLCPVLERPAI